MNKILTMSLTDDYKIVVELANGSSFQYNLKPKLKTARFAPLEDIEFFKTGKLVDNDYIWWNNNLILYAYEMLDGMKR